MRRGGWVLGMPCSQAPPSFRPSVPPSSFVIASVVNVRDTHGLTAQRTHPLHSFTQPVPFHSTHLQRGANLL